MLGTENSEDGVALILQRLESAGDVDPADLVRSLLPLPSRFSQDVVQKARRIFERSARSGLQALLAEVQTNPHHCPAASSLLANLDVRLLVDELEGEWACCASDLLRYLDPHLTCQAVLPEVDLSDRAHELPLRALRCLGHDAVPALVQAAQCPQTVMAALAGLGNLGLDAGPATPDILKIAEECGDGKTREEAGRALVRIGRGAVPALWHRLRHGASETKLWYIDILRKIGGPATPTLIAAFPRLDQFKVAPAAADAATRIGLPALPYLCHAIEINRHPLSVLWSVRALGWMGSKAESAVPTLLSTLSHETRQVREEAVRAIGRLGIESSDIIDALTRLVRHDRSEEVRTAAVFAIGDLQAKAPNAVQAVVEAISDRNGDVRRAAAWTSVQIGKPALEPLTLLLDHPSAAVRRLAARAFVEIDPSAPEVRFGKVKSIAIQTALKTSFGGIDIDRVRRGALPPLESPSSRVVRKPVDEQSAQDVKLGQEFGEALTSMDVQVRRRALLQIDQHVVAPSALVPQLVEALREPSLRGDAAAACGRLGLVTEELLAALTELLKAQEPGIRRVAAVAIGQIDTEGLGPIDALEALLVSDPDPTVRRAAAAGLAWLGPKAVTALPALDRAKTSPDKTMRWWCDHAITRIKEAHRDALEIKVYREIDPAKTDWLIYRDRHGWRL